MARQSFGTRRSEKPENLKYLHCGSASEIDATFLTGLEQLKSQLLNRIATSGLFNQKQRYGCTDLKIFLFGLLLNGPEDPFSSFRISRMSSFI